MRITNIRVQERASIADYEHIEFAAEAVIEEGESVQEATAKLTDFVNWNARRPLREAHARKYRQALAEVELPAEDKNFEVQKARKQEATNWLKKYDERKAVVESL